MTIPHLRELLVDSGQTQQRVYYRADRITGYALALRGAPRSTTLAITQNRDWPSTAVTSFASRTAPVVSTGFSLPPISHLIRPNGRTRLRPGVAHPLRPSSAAAYVDRNASRRVDGQCPG